MSKERKPLEKMIVKMKKETLKVALSGIPISIERARKIVNDRYEELDIKDFPEYQELVDAYQSLEEAVLRAYDEIKGEEK